MKRVKLEGTAKAKSPIPFEFLSKMGRHRINIDGVKILARTADNAAVVDKHIAELRSQLDNSTKVVGVDAKNVKETGRHGTYNILILCVHCRCLIIQLEYMGLDVPKSLINFFKDPNICFVGLKEMPEITYSNYGQVEVGVEMGELAARVLKKPSLIKSSLNDITKEVKVPYEAPSGEKVGKMLVGSVRPFVLSDDQVKVAINEAFAHYRIGFKLLSSL